LVPFCFKTYYLSWYTIFACPICPSTGLHGKCIVASALLDADAVCCSGELGRSRDGSTVYYMTVVIVEGEGLFWG